MDDEKLLNGTKGPPKLRKNKRLEQRWGQNYYPAVKEAVFMVRENPHMPAEPPLSIREEADDCQPLYVCQQCKDCFRFLSSYEAHNSRRSWILGYWCHNCFFIDCSHAQKGQPPCFDCQTINRQRTTFLRAKGLRKGRKMGSIKIFYNQCQYFAHLREHNTTIVDMADVMLMPLPVDVDKESYPQLELLCETIMERMFLTRTHILDWLRSQQLGTKWWSVLQDSFQNDEGPLAELLSGSGRNRKKSVKHPPKTQKVINNGLASPAAASPASSSVTCPSSSETLSSISETIESVIAQSTSDDTTPLSRDKNPEMPPLTSITHIDPLEPVEDDDNPCTTADIAFVDCGPAARTYPPDVAIVIPAKDTLSLIPNGDSDCSSIVDVTPVKVDQRLPVRISKPSIILKQRSADKDIHTNSVSTDPTEGQRPFESKISVKKFANERLKTAPVVACQKNYSRVNNQAPQSLRKLAPASKVRIPRGNTVMEIARVVESSKKPGAKALLPSLGPKIVTVHSPKSTQLSKIISQLPPDVINGKKIVFIGQDAERFTILPNGNDAVNSSLGMIKIQTETDKAKIVPIHPAKIAPLVVSNTGGEQSVRVASESKQKSSSPDKLKPQVQQIFLDGKVIYQDGKKFIIRHARKSVPETTACSNINNLKLHTIPKRVSLSSLLPKPRFPVTSYVPIAAKPVDVAPKKQIFPLTLAALTSASTFPSSSLSQSLSPSLTISEDPKGSQPKVQIKRICSDSENSEKLASSVTATASVCTPPVRDVFDAVEYFSIEKNAAGDLYVDFSKAKELSCMQSVATYKPQMFHHCRPLSAAKIKQQIEDLNEVNAEFSKMLGVTNNARISENLKAIKGFEDALQEEPLGLEQDQNVDQGSEDEDIREILLNSKETRETPSTCSTCNKSVDTERQIFESKASVNSPSCRSCNNYICHICNVFQGNMSRFRAHLNYHAKKEPFTCPECFRKFSSFHRLETHTWTTCFHLLTRRWFKCRVCKVEGFLNMESVTKHFIVAHSKLKIACPECGIISKSRNAFQKHCAKDHPNVTTQMKPVNLMLCDVGNCLVRLENYRSHMDHHTAIYNMLYYKCTFCPVLIQTAKRSREQIRAHLYDKHLDKMAELGFENLYLENLMQSCAAEDNSQNDDNTKNDQGNGVMESEQASNVSDCADKNSGVITLDDAPNNSQTENQSSPDYLDAKLTKQSLKDGVECSVWSINLGQTESPESMDLGSESLEIMTAVQDPGHTCNNVISEYSSSPKIFDVRSVTPDSYAEFGEVAKEQSDASGILKEGISAGFVEMNVLGSRDHVVVSEGGNKDSIIIKMGEQLLPMKLPQVIVINDAESDVNLTEMLQSTWTGSNTFVKLSDLTKSAKKTVTSNVIDLETEQTEKGSGVPSTKDPVIKTVYTLGRPPGFENSEKITIGSTTVRKLPAPVSGRKQTLPVSLLKPKNGSIHTVRTGISEPNNHVSDSYSRVADGSQIISNTSEERTRDVLLCDVPKPPPLSRIPQRLLDEPRVEDKVEEEEVQEVMEITTSPRSMVKSRPRQRRPWRIALNGPICSSELVNYQCHLCGELINTSWSVIEDHFSSRHSQDYKLAIVTPRLLRMSSDFIAEGYREVLGSKKRKSDGIIPCSKRRRRWNPKKHVEKHTVDAGLCVQQESVQDGEGNFVCRKCDQQCNDISSLRTHIGTHHRIKDHYLVCLECGENFVVEPSLQMHLKAFHRIQDPCAYLAQNTAYVKEITETVEDESNTGIANQCHVCMAVFEDKLAVDKHLRVHGMAFLNRKRIEARNAARNPEKKLKVDKPEDSLTDAAQKNEKLENLKLGNPESINGEVRES